MSAEPTPPSSISRRSPRRLPGLEIFMRDDRSPLYRHGIVAKIVGELHRPAGEILLVLAQPAGLRRDLQDLARRKRLSGLPERARTGERPPPGQPAAGHRSPRPTSCATRWRTSSCATRNSRRRCRSRWPSGSIWRTSRTATCSARSCWPRRPRSRSTRRPSGPIYLVHWATFDGSANLPLIYMATVEDSSEAMVAQLVGAGRQAQRQGRHPAAGRRPAQSRARPPLRRFHREELGLFAVAGDDRRQSRQGFRDAASQAAAPRRARAVLFGRHHREQFDGDRGAVQGAQGRKMPGC